jgi:hypothetical protein
VNHVHPDIGKYFIFLGLALFIFFGGSKKHFLEMFVEGVKIKPSVEMFLTNVKNLKQNNLRLRLLSESKLVISQARQRLKHAQNWACRKRFLQGIPVPDSGRE